MSFPACQKMCSCGFAWQAWHFVTLDMFQEECVCGVCVHGRGETKVGVSVDEAMDDATETCLSQSVRRCAHVVLRGKRGTL